MPNPVADDSEAAISVAYAAKSEIIAAINKISSLANGQTWSGPPADAWVQQLNNYVKAALASLGEPLDAAVTEARGTATKMMNAQAAAALASKPK